MTPEEMARIVLAHQRILDSDNGRFVRKDLYDNQMIHLLEDVAEVRDTLRWALRLLVTQFLGLLVTLVVLAVVATQ